MSGWVTDAADLASTDDDTLAPGRSRASPRRPSIKAFQRVPRDRDGTLLKTAERWPQVVAGGQPEAYVRRVMINQRTSWWRRSRAVPRTFHPPAAAADPADRTPDRLLMAGALAALSPRQRAVVVLRFYE